MLSTRTGNIRLLKILVVIIVIGLIVTYVIFRTLNYARGPQIEIFEPTNGSTATSSVIHIKGQARRVNSISLNGNPISMTSDGLISEVIVIFPGLNKITISASDQFGRNTKKELDIVGTMDIDRQKMVI